VQTMPSSGRRGNGQLDRDLLRSKPMARRLEGAAHEALLRRLAELGGLREDHLFAEGQLLETREPDPVDVASDQSRAAFLERLSEAELRELDSIHRALRKIDQGTYGLCDDCGEPIASRRLEALPWAARCVECEANAETQSSRRSGVP